MKVCRFFLCLCIIINFDSGYAQNILTIAGNGVSISSGDGGPATAARVGANAMGVFDATGNYYFGEAGANPRIRMINTLGIIKTVAGNGMSGFSGDNGPATAAKLKDVRACVDFAGNIYIADYTNYRVRKVDVATGIIHTIGGNGTNSSTGNGGPATAATIIPIDLCSDNAGNIFVSDNAGSIRKINESSGIITHVAGVSAQGMCFDALGYLYLGGGTRILKLDTFTSELDTIAGTGFGGPFNGDGILATAANFQAFDITLDASGNIYLADMGLDRVRIINTSQIINTVAGTGTNGYNGDGIVATSADLHDPEGVAIDLCGNLIINDNSNFRVRKVIFNPAIPSISIAATPSNTICAGTAVTYTATVAGAATAVFDWYVNGVVVSTTGSSTYTYIPGDMDSVRCVLRGVGQCSGTTDTVSSNTVNMMVVALRKPAISLAGVTSASAGASVTITATVTGAGSSYDIHWYRNGVLLNTTSAPIMATTYTKGAGTDAITATVVPVPVATIPVCYDSATSAVHTVSVVTVAVSPSAGLRTTEIKIWPNPVGEELHISFIPPPSEGAGGVTYHVYSIVGRVLVAGELNEGDKVVGVKELPAGLYIVEVVRQAHDDNGVRERYVTRIFKR